MRVVRRRTMVGVCLLIVMGLLVHLPNACAVAKWTDYEKFNAQVLYKVDTAIAALNKAKRHINKTTKANGVMTAVARLIRQMPVQPVATLKASIGTMTSDDALLGKLDEFFSLVQEVAAALKAKGIHLSRIDKKKNKVAYYIGSSVHASGGLRKRLAQFLRIVFVDLQTPPPTEDPRFLSFYSRMWQSYQNVEQALGELYHMAKGRGRKNSAVNVASVSSEELSAGPKRVVASPAPAPVKVQTVMVPDKQCENKIQKLKKYVDQEFASVRSQKVPACGLNYDHISPMQGRPKDINKTLSTFAYELYRATIMDMHSFIAKLNGVATLHDCLPLFKDAQVIKSLTMIKSFTPDQLQGLEVLHGLTNEQIAGLQQVKAIGRRHWDSLALLEGLTSAQMAGLTVCASIADDQWEGLKALKNFKQQHFVGLAQLAEMNPKSFENLDAMGKFSDEHLVGLLRLRKLTHEHLHGLKAATHLTKQHRVGLEKITQLNATQLEGLGTIAAIPKNQWEHLDILKNLSTQHLMGLDKLQQLTQSHLSGLANIQRLTPDHMRGMHVVSSFAPHHIEGLAAIANPATQAMLQVLQNHSVKVGLSKLREPVAAALTNLSGPVLNGLRQLHKQPVREGLSSIGDTQARGLARITPEVAAGLARIKSDAVAQGLEKLHSDVSVMAAVQALGTGTGAAALVEEATVNPLIRNYFAEGGAGKYRVDEIIESNVGQKVEELRVAVEYKLQALIDAVKEVGRS